jgi:hypothetical protein
MSREKNERKMKKTHGRICLLFLYFFEILSLVRMVMKGVGERHRLKMWRNIGGTARSFNLPQE